MSTLGELYDALKAIDEAQDDIDEARRSIGFGGSPSTMEGKRRRLVDAEQHLAYLRNEPIPGSTTP